MVMRYRGGITCVIVDAVRNVPEPKVLVAEMVVGLCLAEPLSAHPEAPWHVACSASSCCAGSRTGTATCPRAG